MLPDRPDDVKHLAHTGSAAMLFLLYIMLLFCVYSNHMFSSFLISLMFIWQACLLSHLQHPNIVSYKESFQDSAGVLHIIMGYCEGGDLGSRLKTYGGQLLPETRVVEWFVQIALALQYLHERNILHRDLKVSCALFDLLRHNSDFHRLLLPSLLPDTEHFLE